VVDRDDEMRQIFKAIDEDNSKRRATFEADKERKSTTA
jgi:hypothetical protein